MSDWIDRFSGLARLPDSLRRRLVEASRVVDLPAGAVIFGPGKAPEHLLLLLDGVVRVHQTAESGRDIVLYRVHAGESCVLTTACLLAYEDYAAEGVADTAVRAVAIPRGAFEAMMAESAEFRRFVFAAYSRRITDLFLVIQEIAFARVDVRLAHKLLELADAAGAVRMTHQQLATELGTAREVISRQLNEFQRRGWVEAARGEVRVRAPEDLKAYAQTA